MSTVRETDFRNPPVTTNFLIKCVKYCDTPTFISVKCFCVPTIQNGCHTSRDNITFSHNIPPSRKPSGILQPSYLLLPLECAQSQAARRGYNTHYISMSLFCHPPQHSTHCPSKSAYHRPSSSPRSIHSNPSWNTPKADRARPSPGNMVRRRTGFIAARNV